MCRRFFESQYLPVRLSASTLFFKRRVFFEALPSPVILEYVSQVTVAILLLLKIGHGLIASSTGGSTSTQILNLSTSKNTKV